MCVFVSKRIQSQILQDMVKANDEKKQTNNILSYDNCKEFIMVDTSTNNNFQAKNRHERMNIG